MFSSRPLCYLLQLLEDLLTLLDLLTVWEAGNEWMEMEQLGLRLLLAFAAQRDIEVTARHTSLAL